MDTEEELKMKLHEHLGLFVTVLEYGQIMKLELLTMISGEIFNPKVERDDDHDQGENPLCICIACQTVKGAPNGHLQLQPLAKFDEKNSDKRDKIIVCQLL